MCAGRIGLLPVHIRKRSSCLGIFFQKWKYLMSNDEFSTTFAFHIRSFPLKMPVLTKPKARQDEPDNDSFLILRSLFELASSRA